LDEICATLDVRLHHTEAFQQEHLWRHVAVRIDRGGFVVSAASMKKFMKERGFLGTLHVTSAKTGEGCDELREAIVQAID